MLLRWLNIILLLAGVLIISYFNPTKEPTIEEAESQNTQRFKISPVQHISSATLSANISTNYTSISIPVLQVEKAPKLGQIIEAKISEVSARQVPVKTKEWTDIFYSSSNPPVKLKSKWQVRLFLDNDIFDNRDYYYTNGFRIDLIAPFLNRSPLRHILIGLKKAQIEFNGISIRQNIYTPTNPDVEDILIGDRPFSAFLSIGQFREVYDLSRNIHIRSGLNLGVIGPSALGGQVQSQIHEIEPVGWPNQINNDLIIDYHVQFSKGIISSPIIEFNATGKANIGTLYNKIGGGLDMRFGHFMPVYWGPLSVFEFINPGARLQYWLFLKGEVNIVGYDATMQGGLFNRENPYVINSIDINRFVFQSSIGFAIYYNNIGFEYEHYYQTPEFKGANHFGWGRIKAVLAF